MNSRTIGAGVFPDVAGGRGLFWLIARRGDPRTAGDVSLYLWEADRVDQIRELARIAVPAGSPAFPRVCLFRDELWFAYHDGHFWILRNASTSETISLAPCQNNDPICFGSGYVAWQGAQADGWPITRMDLRSRERIAAGNGQGTGLSRVTEDGRVVLVDADREAVPGGTRPAWAGDLVVIEKHGNRGALARLKDAREAFLWPDVQIITPRCAYEPSLDLYAVVGWSESDGQIRAAVLRDEDFRAPSVPVPEPPRPTPIPTPEPVMQLDTVTRIRAKYPTPLGSRHAAFLLELAKAIGDGAGLLRKDGGTNIALPDGTKVAQDIICYPNGRIFDVLEDGEGDADPTWGEANGSPVETSRYYQVTDTPIPPPLTPHVYDGGDHDTGVCDICLRAWDDPIHLPSAPPADVDWDEVLDRLESIDAKLTELLKPHTYAIRSEHGYLSIQSDGRMEWNRQSVGSWELIKVEPQS